jgi:hypothetical protein
VNVRISPGAGNRDLGVMTWKTIRLELARTDDFPKGSVARSYVMRLPLQHDGTVDEAAFSLNPELATVRRFWPNEPDRHGYMIHTPDGWSLAPVPERPRHRGSNPPIRRGSVLLLTEPGGNVMPYEVKDCSAG